MIIVNGLITIMENIKVKTAIVGIQGEESPNYKEFLELAKKKKIKILMVHAGDKIQIDKDCSISILFPNQDLINTNILNNNSIVAKFSYQSKNSQEFSILLTGDIEEIAENKLIQEYKDTNELQATVLKIAHHRL